ncbi:rhodanese-like domain-containing protein [Candidatus Gillettellia adelgis]
MLQEIIPFINKHLLLSITWVTLLIAVIIKAFKSCFSEVKAISPHEAVQLINKKNGIVVDTRNRNDFHKGHLTNATSLTINDIKSGNLGDLVKHKTQPIIVVCTNGIASFEAAKNLYKAGFIHVVILKQGIAGWSYDNLPLVKTNTC